MNTKSKIQEVVEHQSHCNEISKKINQFFEMYNIDDIFIDKNGTELLKGYFVPNPIETQTLQFENMNEVVDYMQTSGDVVRIVECGEEGNIEYEIITGKLMSMHELPSKIDFRCTDIETYEEIQ